VEGGARGEEALGAAMWEALGALEAPCLLVRGMRSSSVVDDADEAELRARLPTARVERLDAGHSVQGDAPVALAQVIASFLPPSCLLPADANVPALQLHAPDETPGSRARAQRQSG